MTAANLDKSQLLGTRKSSLSFLILGIGVAISIALCWIVKINVENEAQLRFERQASDAHHNIEARVKSYTDIVYGLRALFRSSDLTSRKQFHNYIAGLDLTTRFPGVLVLNYAENVPANAKKRFELEVKSDTSLLPRGYPDFAIKPSGDRPYYHVLKYIEPLAGNEVALGRDILMQPGRKEVFENLMYSYPNELASSGRPVVIGGSNPHWAIAMRLPVFRSNMPLDTLEQRRAAFQGTLGAGIQVRELMQNVLDMPILKTLRFKVYEAGPAQQSAAAANSHGAEDRLLLFDSLELLKSVPSAASEEFNLTTVLPLTVAGRIWEFHFSTPIRGMISRRDAALPWLVLFGGFVISLLLFGTAYSLASSRARAVALAREITRDLRQSEEELRSSAERLRSVSRHLVEIQETERRVLARELHDRVGQNLTALGLNLSIVSKHLPESAESKLAKRLVESASLVEETMDSMRNVMGELRPQGLDEYGLLAPLRSLTAKFSERTGIRVNFDAHEPKSHIPRAVDLAMFRIAQEALNNIAKHSRATHVRVKYSETSGRAILGIEDDGVGFDSTGIQNSKQESGWGLSIMRERAEAVGALIALDASPGRGTRLLVEYVC